MPPQRLPELKTIVSVSTKLDVTPAPAIPVISAIARTSNGPRCLVSHSRDIDPPDQPSVSTTQDCTPDGGHTAVDVHPPLINPSNPLFDDNGAFPVVPNSKANASSFGLLPMDVPSSGLNRSSSICEPEFPCDHDSCNAGGQPPASSMPCGADTTPDGGPPSDPPPHYGSDLRRWPSEFQRPDSPHSFTCKRLVTVGT
ncbi:hypothetical protein EDB83DRAFT_2531799 [Lactarius deliciosus]|nr:hypothetical protein EDB83DRAFT_2531799 [Lactarius deliciosus]